MHKSAGASDGKPKWGDPPWSIRFQPSPRELPERVDCAVIGGGFSGLSAAAWLRRFSPASSVAVFEAGSIGGGASGRTGGMALAETAAGDLPGLGDVLAGLSSIVQELGIDCDLLLPGAWEISHVSRASGSAISWNDSGGELRVAGEVPGGTVDPGELVSGLARSAEQAGASIFENAEVSEVRFEEPLRLTVGGREVQARKMLFATNAMSLELSGLVRRVGPRFTLAVATESLATAQIESLGLSSRRPFYTIDFPYLWGRLLPGNGIIFGAGLIEVQDWRELAAIDVATGRAAELFARFKKRVSRFHPVLRDIQFTHQWGGPILFPEEWRPIFERHPRSANALVLGGYAGHGVALSVYLGRWAAEAMLDRRELPNWKDL